MPAHPALLQSVPLTLEQTTFNPYVHWKLPDTHRQVWLSLLWCHFSCLLGPGVHKLLFVASVNYGFPGGSDSKASICNAGDMGSIPGLGKSPGEGNGNPLQHSCLESPVDRRTWWATVHGMAKSQTRLSDFTFSHFQ